MAGPISRLVEQRATRLGAMMKRQNVDPVKLARLRGGTAYAEARDVCLRCHNGYECLAWLESDPAGQESPSFCPNLALLRLCRSEDLCN